MAYTGKDYTNVRNGNLTYIKQVRSGGKGKPRIWLAKCDCGREKEIPVAWRRGTKTCAHEDCEFHKAIIGKSTNPLTLEQKNIAARKMIYKAYVNKARYRNYTWNLSESEFNDLISQNCHYCSSAPRNRKVSTHLVVVNGVDRTDNTKGYSTDNCVPCCTTCNAMKMSMSQDGFFNQIKRIYELHQP